MTEEAWKSRDQRIQELEQQVRDLAERLERQENPKKNYSSLPNPVHSAPKEREQPTKEEIIEAFKTRKPK